MRRFLLALVSTLAAGCGDSVYVGSDVLWSATHETANFDEWSLDGRGAAQVDDGDGSVSITDAFAHRGRYSAKLEKIVSGNAGRAGPRLIRYDNLPRHAFYSAWYFIPEAYTTASYWTIMQFDSSAASSSIDDRGINLQLRSLPDGNGLVLQVLFHVQTYLASPLAYPAPKVPIGRWFQVEAEFDANEEATGMLVIWLDGQRVYDLRNRPTVDPTTLEFMVSSMMIDANPSPVDLYVDDIVISASRAGVR